jgi:hypothetical protein
MNLEKLDTTELINVYSKIISLLKVRGVIRTKNLIGDLGEFLAIEYFNNNYEVEKIIQLNWSLFLKHKKWHKTMQAWNITITKSLLNEAEILFNKTKDGN